jgi:hypothetical protein
MPTKADELFSRIVLLVASLLGGGSCTDEQRHIVGAALRQVGIYSEIERAFGEDLGQRQVAKVQTERP